LRIVLFTASYAPRVGGLETAAAHLAREFQALDHHVTVVTNRYPRDLPRRERIDGVAVHRILFPAAVVPRSAWTLTSLGTFLLLLPLAPGALLRLWLLLRSLRPTVVNAHYLSSPALYVALLKRLGLLRARVVVSCHGSDVTAVPPPSGSRALSRWILAQADAVTACSADLAGRVAALVDRIPGGAVRVVYNGTDVDEFAGAVPFPHPRPYIFSAGRLVETKGMRVLVEALAVLRARGVDRDLIIAGAGPEEAALRALVERLGLGERVHFDGPVGRARLASLYHGCAVFALAPLAEGFGIVSLEAMACARPVVATRVGGIPEVVQDGETGLLARPADPADLADRLAVVLSDPARAAEMGRRGRERVATLFTWPAVAARYLASYALSSPDSEDADPVTVGIGTASPGAATHQEDRPGVSWERHAPPHQQFIDPETRDESVMNAGGGRGGDVARTRAATLIRSTFDDIWSRSSAGSMPILMYHQIAPWSAEGVKPSLLVTPAAFAAQMRLLRLWGWRTLRLVELVALLEAGAPLPRRRFVLTFDDAFLGVARHAVPVMRGLGLTATVFVPTALVGTDTALDGGRDHPAKRLLGWDDLRAMRDARFDIGAHTRRHPHLPLLGADELRAEVAGSRDDLAAALGAGDGDALFAYPYGDWDPSVAAAVRDAGFAAACATRFGRVTAASAPFALPRISVGSSLDLPHFAYRLLRADRIAARIAAGADRPGARGPVGVASA